MFRRVAVLFLLSVSLRITHANTDIRREPIAKPYLIIPGYSVGKVKIGMKQSDVHRKMGEPLSSRIIRLPTVNDKGERVELRGVLEIWKRPISEEEYMKWGPDTFNWFEVYYINYKVAKITICGLMNYRTKDGLSLSSSFEDFKKHLGLFIDSQIDNDPDPPSGSSHSITYIRNFYRDGIELRSWPYAAGDAPQAIFEITVYSSREHRIY